MDGKSMALQLGRARNVSLSSFLVFSTTFVGINRSLASQRLGSLIRPLLSISRNDVKILCRFWGLPIYPDVTNQTIAFSRNRIRKQLLPALRVALNPQIDSVLSQSAEIMFVERLQQDLLALKLLRAYQHVPRFEHGRSGEEKGNQAKWRPRVMERQYGQRSNGALVGHIKPRLHWDGVRWPLLALGGGLHPEGMQSTAKGQEWPTNPKALLGGGLCPPFGVSLNGRGPSPNPCKAIPSRPHTTAQPSGGPKRPLTSVDMSVVGATRADYGRTLAAKSRDLQAVWLGFGKTGAFLGARNPCHHHKQCPHLLHKRRGCLFLPQIGIFFSNLILPPRWPLGHLPQRTVVPLPPRGGGRAWGQVPPCGATRPAERRTSVRPRWPGLPGVRRFAERVAHEPQGSPSGGSSQPILFPYPSEGAMAPPPARMWKGLPVRQNAKPLSCL